VDSYCPLQGRSEGWKRSDPLRFLVEILSQKAELSGHIMCPVMLFFFLFLACGGTSRTQGTRASLSSDGASTLRAQGVARPLTPPLNCASVQNFCTSIPAYQSVERVLKDLEGLQQNVSRSREIILNNGGGPEAGLMRNLLAILLANQTRTACNMFVPGGLAHRLRECVEALRLNFSNLCVAKGKSPRVCSSIMNCLSSEKIGELTNCKSLVVAMLAPFSSQRQLIEQSCRQNRFEYELWCAPLPPLPPVPPGQGPLQSVGP
jgi:hypothetical protein